MTAFALLYGSERRPLRLDFPLSHTVQFGPFPYHGIIPRGLLQRVDEIAPEIPGEWDLVAPVLEDLLTKRLSLSRADPTAPAVRRLERWYRAAREEQVLSLRESAAVARICAEHWLKRRGRDMEGDCAVELWLVREGHTASVWRLRLHRGPKDLCPPLCLNVARDRAAAIELRHSTELLRAAAQVDPCRVVTFRETREVALPIDLHRSAYVAVFDWLEGARELHLVARSQPGIGHLFAVDSFVMSASSKEAPEQRLLGQFLDSEDAEAVWREHLGFVVRHARFDNSKKHVAAPEVEVNEGDRIILPCGRTVVVGASAPAVPRPLGDWLLALVLTGAPTVGRRLLCGDPAAALATIVRELRLRSREAPGLTTCLAAASRAWRECSRREQLAGPLEDRIEQLLGQEDRAPGRVARRSWKVKHGQVLRRSP